MDKQESSRVTRSESGNVASFPCECRVLTIAAFQGLHEQEAGLGNQRQETQAPWHRTGTSLLTFKISLMHFICLSGKGEREKERDLSSLLIHTLQFYKHLRLDQGKAWSQQLRSPSGVAGILSTSTITCWLPGAHLQEVLIEWQTGHSNMECGFSNNVVSSIPNDHPWTALLMTRLFWRPI